MVKFCFPKDRILQNEKACCFLIGNLENGSQYWCPKKKMNVYSEGEEEDCLIIEMPKWVFSKSPLMPYVEIEENVATFNY